MKKKIQFFVFHLKKKYRLFTLSKMSKKEEITTCCICHKQFECRNWDVKLDNVIGNWACGG